MARCRNGNCKLVDHLFVATNRVEGFEWAVADLTARMAREGLRKALLRKHAPASKIRIKVERVNA